MFCLLLTTLQRSLPELREQKVRYFCFLVPTGIHEGQKLEILNTSRRPLWPAIVVCHHRPLSLYIATAQLRWESKPRLLCSPRKSTSPHPTGPRCTFLLPAASHCLPAFAFLHSGSARTGQIALEEQTSLKSQWLRPTVFLVHFTHHLWVGRESLPIKVVTQEFKQPPAGCGARGRRILEGLALTMKRPRLEATAIIPHRAEAAPRFIQHEGAGQRTPPSGPRSWAMGKGSRTIWQTALMTSTYS